jgi:hypothetical protein
MYYLVNENMFWPMLLRYLQVGWKQRNVFRNETYLHYTRFKVCSDWSHVIPSSLLSTLTAFSFPAHATKLPVSCVGIMWHKNRKERLDYEFSSTFHYSTRALQNKRGSAVVFMTSDSKLPASYIRNDGVGSKWRFVIPSLFHKLQGESQAVFV